jgi:MinD-like ATPase involved in chromosome partitioning or flagellar assembly
MNEGTSVSASRGDEIGPIPPKRPAVIAFGAVNGRTPRTLTASLLAEAIARRGMRVLVVEGDLPNMGFGTSFGVAPGTPSYLRARQQAPTAWASPESLRSLVVPSAMTGADLLLASDGGAQSSAGLTLNDWALLMNAVRTLLEYDLVIVDMGTDTPRLPYLLMNVRAGDWLLLTLAPDDKERTRATAALKWLGFADRGDQPQPPLLAYLERHEDDRREIERLERNIRQEFPRALSVGTIPRAPRQLLADAQGGPASPLTLAPTSPLSTALQALAARLSEVTGIGSAGPAGPAPQ